MPETSKSLLSLRPMAGAFTSRLLWTPKVLNVGDGLSQGQLILGPTLWQVDPTTPYYYIFTNGPTFEVDDGMGGAVGGDLCFRTDFSFSNGGVPVSNISAYWGNSFSLDLSANIGPAATVLPIIESPRLLVHDPISEICPYSLPDDNTFGIITRWSSLADKVSASTYFLGGGSGIPSYPAIIATKGGTVLHGILQQPWH